MPSWFLQFFIFYSVHMLPSKLVLLRLPPPRQINFTGSICSEELIFQFSAKSDNIYYVFPQNRQNHSFILPPLGGPGLSYTNVHIKKMSGVLEGTYQKKLLIRRHEFS